MEMGPIWKEFMQADFWRSWVCQSPLQSPYFFVDCLNNTFDDSNSSDSARVALRFASVWHHNHSVRKRQNFQPYCLLGWGRREEKQKCLCNLKLKCSCIKSKIKKIGNTLKKFWIIFYNKHCLVSCMCANFMMKSHSW